MEDTKRYEIHIRSRTDPEYLHILGKGGVSERRADRIDEGISINLNHDEYYTEIVEVEAT